MKLPAKKIQEWLKEVWCLLKKVRYLPKKVTKMFVRIFICSDARKRYHSRRLFFEKAFQELENPIVQFTGIKGNSDSFYNAYRKMAGSYDFYPFDRKYRMKEAGEIFRDYCNQTYDSLSITIERKTNIFKMVRSKYGKYTISADVTESGNTLNISYEITYFSKEGDAY